MTLQHIADKAGVSASTVSRVINSMPGITAETIENVRQAMKALSYTPSPRRRPSSRTAAETVHGAKVAFVVLNLDGNQSVPAYDYLLRGVSAAANHYHIDLHVMFVSDIKSVVERVSGTGFDGLILHGTIHPPEMSRPLRHIPTVWLMGNRRRPVWGDQVMPDNATAGQLAAQYLLRNKHRRVMFFGIRSAWWLGVRMLAFQQAIEDAGGSVVSVAAPLSHVDRNAPDDLTNALVLLSKTYGDLPQKPTGLFIAEDWLVRPVYNKLRSDGVEFGPNGDIEVVSCNYDRAHLIGANPMPATIDIHYEKIGFRAVEQLTFRLMRKEPLDRVRIMLEPTLLLPPTAARQA